jgi:hypothetical protein
VATDRLDRHPVIATVGAGLLVGVVSLAAMLLGVHVTGLVSAAPVTVSVVLFSWQADEALAVVSFACGPVVFWLSGARSFRGARGVSAGALLTLAIVGALDVAFLIWTWIAPTEAPRPIGAMCLYTFVNVLGLSGLIVSGARLHPESAFRFALAHRAAFAAWLLAVGFFARA